MTVTEGAAPVADPGAGAPPVVDPAAGAPAVDPGAGATPELDPKPATGGLSPEAEEKELRRARDDAARYRTNLRKYEEHFEGFEPDEVDYALKMYAAIQKDPAKALEMFEQTTENLRKLAPAKPTTGEPDPKDKPLTRADLEAIELERETAKQVAAIEAKATELKYVKGSGDYTKLLWIARNDPRAEADIDKAHAIIEEEKKAIVQQYIDSLGKPSKFPPVANGAPGSPATEQPQKDTRPAKVRALDTLTKHGF